MCGQLPLVKLLRGPLHDGSVHSVLHSQHVADGVPIHALQALKQRLREALQTSRQLLTGKTLYLTLTTAATTPHQSCKSSVRSSCCYGNTAA